jgi:ribosomal protein S1
MGDIRIGDIVMARVEQIEPFGIFISFDDEVMGIVDVPHLTPDGRRIDGIIDVLHLSPDGSPLDRDALPQPGEQVEVVVLEYQDNDIFKVSRLESLKEMGARRKIIGRWEAYRNSISLGTKYEGWIRRDTTTVCIGEPFYASLVASRIDVDDPANRGRSLRCRVVGFDDRVQRVLVEEVQR